MHMAAFFNRRNYRQYLLAISCLLAAILIGLIRFLTGPEFALSLFYILPIALATWYAGKWVGFMVSLASAVSWLVADLNMLPAFSSAWIPPNVLVMPRSSRRGDGPPISAIDREED